MKRKNLKKAFIIQTAVCIVIAAVYGIIHSADLPMLQNKSAEIVSAMSKHYTVSDIKDNGKTAVMSVIKAPAVVTGHIIASREKQEYGTPIDKAEKGETTSIYAVAGGRVIETGTNDELGNYIIIQHEDAVSTYGNCSRLYVKETEHVRKGQVIASFVNDGTNEFYYHLEEAE